MSNEQTGFLFPRAGIHFFVTDDATRKMACELEKDWRFARIGIEIFEGDIQTAITFYADKASPDIIIVETDTIDDNFTGNLDGLAGVCLPHTSALFIGPVNDIPLYRKLIDMGVTDYIVRPIKKEAFIGILANTLVEKLGTAESRFIPILGAKGGVGTSNIAEALGFTMTEKLDEKTVLMDGAGGWGSLRISFGIEPVMQQTEAVGVATNGPQEDVEQLLYSATDKLRIMACGGDPLLGITMSGMDMEAIINRFMRTNPVVIADMSNAQSEAKYIAVARANHIVLVTSPLIPSLRNTRRLLKEISDLRGGQTPISLVVNMQGIAPGLEASLDDISETLGIKPAAVIPYNPKLFNAMLTGGKKFHELKEGIKVLDALLPIAQNVWGEKRNISTSKKILSKDDNTFDLLQSLFKKK